MLILLCVVIGTILTYDNVGKLYIGQDCNPDNLFGIASVISSSNLGFLELPRVYGTCHTEEHYDSYFDMEVTVSSRETCDVATNVVSYSGWFNSTECLETDPDWTGTHELGECENNNNSDTSTVSWCTHNVLEDLPHLAVYSGEGCDDSDILFHLWARPNYCIFVHFDHDDDDPISFIVVQEGSNLSPRQFNSTDCDPDTEIWRDTYTVGSCNTHTTRRTGAVGIAGSLGGNNVMWIAGTSSIVISIIIAASIWGVIILLCIVGTVLLVVTQYPREKPKYKPMK